MDPNANKVCMDEDDNFQVLPQLSLQEEAALQKQHLDKLTKFYSATKPYEMGSWYDQLKEFTFRSHYFELTCIEAYYISLLYYDDQVAKSEKYQTVHKQFITKVYLFLEKNFQQGCFFKLASRSPKDKGWDYEGEGCALHFAKLLKQFILLRHSTEELIQPSLSLSVINTIYQFFLQQSKAKTKVSSGQQLLEVLCKSERIIIDIYDFSSLKESVFQEFKNNEMKRAEQVLTTLWGRQWFECSWAEEFRCFFYDYKLTAITQYDQRCYFKELQNKQLIIKQKIEKFFSKMVPALQQLKMTEGVMDIALTNKQIRLIQINCFNENTRSSLFSWKEDALVLREGPCQVRFIKQYKYVGKYQLICMMGMVSRGIQQVIETALTELGMKRQWEMYQ